DRGKRLAIDAQRAVDAPHEDAVHQWTARDEVPIEPRVERHRPDVRLLVDALEIDQEWYAKRSHGHPLPLKFEKSVCRKDLVVAAGMMDLAIIGCNSGATGRPKATPDPFSKVFRFARRPGDA